MFCKLSTPVTKATDGGLKLLLGLMVKCSCQNSGLLLIDN